MNNRLYECLTITKDIQKLAECIGKETENIVANTKANGVAWDALKERIALSKKNLIV